MFKEYKLGEELGDIVLAVREIKKDFDGFETKAEDMLRFKEDLLPDLENGTHSWTIRYKPEVIRYPISMTWLERNRLEVIVPYEEDNWLSIGAISIPKIVVGHVYDWPEKHEAISGSGWKSKEHMIQGISDIYEPIYGKRLSDNDILIAYALENLELFK